MKQNGPQPLNPKDTRCSYSSAGILQCSSEQSTEYVKLKTHSMNSHKGNERQNCPIKNTITLY